MKLSKKAFAVILCTVLLLAVIPFGSLAASDKIVSEVNINFRSNIAGLDAQNYKEIISISSKGIDYDDDNYSPLYTHTTALGSHGLPYTGKYFSGEEYYFTLYFVPAPGYVFNEDINSIAKTLKIDGNIADIADFRFGYDDHYEYKYLELSFVATVSGTDPVKADRFSLSVSPRIAGLTAADWSKFLKLESNGFAFDSQFYPVVYAYEIPSDGTPPVKRYYGEFVEGTSYELYVELIAKPGYYLPFSMNDVSTVVSVDGVQLSSDEYDAYRIPDGAYCYDCVEICLDVTAQAPTFFEKILYALTDFFASISAFFAKLFSGTI